ncbi:MAG: hypothetical protein WCC17_25835 [Candidatus Nitrosopolaris sp.]
MTIRLDLSFLSGDLRSIIVNSEEIKSFSIDRSADTNRNTSTVADQHDPKTIITLDYKKESLEDFKVILRDILARNHLDNFTIAEDIEAELWTYTTYRLIVFSFFINTVSPQAYISKLYQPIQWQDISTSQQS